ncbi:hypothetical protein [Asticcacaulis taihuensis]|uniref:Uncharacterized protein n=1 Tax=Asticcacaulis taihuensis TaxID=260084 RepID=A0A1G4T426_9CAUL|nr:hypothetical protein [Asticcacaulis taihuensis]SCW76026.1 hypothetical protein SAMN02927928_3232 [Asticcacaulis taihuensis]
MIDVSGFQSAGVALGEDEKDTEQLRAQFEDAQAYIKGFSWSEPIERAYLAFGVGGIFALFLFVFEKAVGGTDKELWVVTGDLPSAYFITDAAEMVPDAIDTYCCLMEEWIVSVEEDDHEIKVFPIAAQRTKANADALRTRIAFLRKNFL